MLLGRAFVEITDRDVDGFEFDFAPGMQLSGVVKPAGKAAVALDSLALGLMPEGAPTRGGGPTAAGTPVSADGAFTIRNVPPDVYHVMVGMPGPGGGMASTPTKAYATSIKLGETELPDGLLDLRRATSEALTITVSADMGRVDGKVTGDDGQPSPRAYVTLISDPSKWDSYSRYQEMDADSEGRFVFEKVPPGRYTLFGWSNVERGAPRDADFGKPFEKLGIPIALEPNGRQTLELKAIDAEKRQ
jgi:hypothetical protein